jgi:hypothetical protein
LIEPETVRHPPTVEADVCETEAVSAACSKAAELN